MANYLPTYVTCPILDSWSHFLYTVIITPSTNHTWLTVAVATLTPLLAFLLPRLQDHVLLISYPSSKPPTKSCILIAVFKSSYQHVLLVLVIFPLQAFINPPELWPNGNPFFSLDILISLSNLEPRTDFLNPSYQHILRPEFLLLT